MGAEGSLFLVQLISVVLVASLDIYDISSLVASQDIYDISSLVASLDIYIILVA